jgi:methyl-accepting chemotaxis protein
MTQDAEGLKAEALAAKCARLFFSQSGGREVVPIREHQLAAVCESAITLAVLELQSRAPSPVSALVEALDELFRCDHAAQFPCTTADELRGVTDRLNAAREKARAILAALKDHK